MSHTPGQLTLEEVDGELWAASTDTKRYIALLGARDRFPDDKANAERFVRAWNCHDELLAACKAALDHVRELRDAWMRGAINERDRLGGTRSNRNVDVEVALAAAIARAEGKPDGEKT